MLRTVPALIPASAFHDLRPQWARRESNPRPGPYKRPALTTELRAVSGAEGTRTLACRIKSSVCCHYTTTPECWSGVSVSIVPDSCSRSLFPVVADHAAHGARSRTQRHSVISRVRATGPRLPFPTKKAWCRRDTRLLGIFREKVRPDVTFAVDRTGAYSPIDRRMYPSILAVRNSAVLKSWLFLAMGSSTRAVYMYSIV